MLAYITGTVDQELLLRNEYLATENRILTAELKGRLLLSDAERGIVILKGLFGIPARIARHERFNPGIVILKGLFG